MDSSQSIGGGNMNMNANNTSNNNNNNNNNEDQLDNLSNLIINTSSGGGGGMASAETALIEQFEYDMDKALSENLANEREQMNQRLFQSFQTSACTVAQMFKDKSTTLPQQQSQLSSWQSFQNAAGAITVLYKDSLESCKAHYELGIAAGQHRKLKEMLGWLKKKKRRTIRKDELLSFLLGRQLMGDEANGGASVVSAFGSSTGLAGVDSQMNGSTAMMMNTQTPFSMFPSKQPFLFRQQSGAQQQAQSATAQFFTRPNVTQTPPIVAATDTSSDLATFREALIMHNRSRDHHMPPPTYTTSSHLHSSTTGTPGVHHTSTSHLQHNNHQQQQQHHSHHHHHHQHQHAQTQACDDLDCFFCEQIATHVDHKRSASQNSNLNGGNFDMESPTRKRGRFY